MKRGRLRGRSDAAVADDERREAVRQAVFARDGWRCVLDRFVGQRFADLVGPRTAVWLVVPACSGRLEFGHRRKASAGGAYVEANGHAVCSGHNAWTENEPDAARAFGGETPWWLVVREGDPEWTELGRKAAGVR